MTGLPSTHFFPETYRFRFPLSPHVAAAKDGICIDLESMVLPQIPGGHLIVEGAGGIMVPLNERHLMLDLMKKLQLPILLVAKKWSRHHQPYPAVIGDAEKPLFAGVWRGDERSSEFR